MKDLITSRFKLSFLPRVQCRLSYNAKRDEWTIDFLRDGQSLGKFSLLHDEMTEDNLSREIAECRALQLSSASAIYEIIEEIYKEIEKMSQHATVDSPAIDSTMMTSDVKEENAISMEGDISRADETPKLTDAAEIAQMEGEAFLPHPTEKLGEIEVSGTNHVILTVEATELPQAYLISFSQHGRTIAGPFKIDNISEDAILETLSDCGIEFYSLSAMYDLSEKIIALIKNKVTSKGGVESQSLDMEEPRETTEAIDRSSKEKATTETVIETTVQEEKPQERPRVTTLLKEIELPYTGGHKALIKFTNQPETYAITILNEEGKEVSDVLFVSKPDEDKLIDLLASADVDFVSISALSDSAELILEAINRSQLGDDEQATEVKTESEEAEDYYPSYLHDESEASEKMKAKPLDISEISLPSLEHLREPEDFETYINEMKKALSENQPLLVAEVPITGAAPGSKVKIYRQGENNWYLSFIAKDVSESKLYPIRAITLDDVARLMNDHVPQISMSALVEQAEKVFEVLKEASARPREEMIINQAVNHFARILEEHEASGNLEKATRLAVLLLNKFQDVQNPHGLVEFGMRLTTLLEKQGRIQEAAGWIIQIFEDLLKIGHKSSLLNFSTQAIDWLTKPDVRQFLEAARFSREVYQVIIAEEDVDLSQQVTWLEKTVNCYCQARITVAVIDLGITETMKLLERAHDKYKTDKKFTKTEFLETTEQLTIIISTSLNYLEEHAEVFEVVDSYKTILNAFKRFGLHEQLLLYAERAMNFYKEHNLSNQLLELSLQLSKELMTKEYHEKAIKFSYLAIQLMHKQKEQPQKMITLCYDVLDGLLKLKLTKEALKHAEFTEQLALSFFPHDKEEISLVYEQVASILLTHDLADHSSIYLQKMIETIKIPEEVMARILKFIDRLMSENKIKIAQNLVNFELARQIQLGNPQNVARISQEFTKMLLKYQHLDLAFDYLKYTYQCYYQINDVSPAVELFHKALPTYISRKRTEEAKFLIDYIVQYHIHLKEETRAIDALRRFIDLLIENGIKGELLEEYIFKTAGIFEEMGDVQGSISYLIEYRDLIQEHDIRLARKLTEEASKRLIDHYEDYNQAVDVLKPLTYQFLEKNDLENAYLYTLQVVGYFELAGDVKASIAFLEEIKPKIMEKGNADITAKFLDFTYRHYLKLNKPKEALNTAKELLQFAESNQLLENTIEAVEKVANVLIRMKKHKEAMDFLEEKIISYLKERRTALSSKLEKITSLYLELLQEHKSNKDQKKKMATLSELMIENDEAELAFPFIKHYFELEKKKHPDNAITYLLQQIKLLIAKNYPRQALETSLELLKFLIEINKLDVAEDSLVTIVEAFLNNKHVSSAGQLVESYLSHVREDNVRIIKVSLSYVKMLINANLVSHARDYVEKIITDLSSKPDFQTNKELQLITARIMERFAMNLQKSHPELYLEYSYRAASQYLKVRNMERTYQIFLHMFEHLPVSTAEKSLKRGVRLLGPITDAQTMKFSLQLRIFILQLRQNSAQETLKETMNEIIDTLLQTNDIAKISEEFAYMFVASASLLVQKELLYHCLAPHLVTIKKKLDENTFIDALIIQIQGKSLHESEINKLNEYLAIMQSILSDQARKTIRKQLNKLIQRSTTKTRTEMPLETKVVTQPEPKRDLTKSSSISESISSEVPSISLLKIKENLEDLRKELIAKTSSSENEEVSPQIPSEDDSLISSIEEEDEQFAQLSANEMAVSPSVDGDDLITDRLQHIMPGVEKQLPATSTATSTSEPTTKQPTINEEEFLKSFEKALTTRMESLELPDLSLLNTPALPDKTKENVSSTDKEPPKEKEKIIKEALNDLNKLMGTDE